MRRFWTIVFPLLSPTTFFLLVVNIVYAFFDTFGIIDAVAGGTPAGDRIDDAERVEEGVDDVDDQQKEGCRRQQRKHDGPESPHRAGAVNCAGLDDAFGDRLQPCQKEQKIIGDLLPYRGHY